jgi:hypothetical protein
MRYFKDKWPKRLTKKIYLPKIQIIIKVKRIIMSFLIKMVKKFVFMNAQKDVGECSMNRFCQNIRKYVKKFFNQKERPLTLQLLDKYKLKAIFKRPHNLLQRNLIKRKMFKKPNKKFQSGNYRALNFAVD